MKSKYLNKICIGNISKNNRSGYIFIINIKNKKNNMIMLEGVYLDGKKFQNNISLNILYKKVEILDPPPSHLIKEFIKRIFI